MHRLVAQSDEQKLSIGQKVRRILFTPIHICGTAPVARGDTVGDLGTPPPLLSKVRQVPTSKVR